MKKTISFILFIGLTSILLNSQSNFTPYDDCPGLTKSCKPSFQNDYPEWAKMLYDYPVNYYEISTLYENSKMNYGNDLKPIIRYYKLWSRNILPWVQQDGTIEMPDLAVFYQKQKDTQFQNQNQDKLVSNWTFLGPKETFWLNESDDPEAPASCPWQVNVYSFDIAVSNNNVMYCGTETGFVNKTTNEADSWELLALNYDFGGGITAVAIDPTNENTVYVAGGNQIHKSVDGGASWTPMLEIGNLFYADEIQIDLNNPNKLIAGSSNGIFISLDGAENWSQPWNGQVYDVKIKPDDSNVIFALGKLGGFFRMVQSNDGGITFTYQENFPSNIIEDSGGLLAVSPDDPDLLMALMLSSGNTPVLYKEDVVDESWELVATGQTDELELNNGQGYYDLVLDISPTDADIVYVGTTTLFKSTNGGASFSVVGGYYGDFAIHPDAQDIKVLGNGEVWLATDGGFTMSSDNFLNPANFISRSNGIIGSDLWGMDQGWNEDVLVGGRYHNGNTAMTDFYNDKALRMGGAESPTGWVMQGKSRHVAFNDLGNGWILPQTAEGAPEGRFIYSKYPNMDEYGGRRGNMVFHPNYYGQIYIGNDDDFWRSSDIGVTWDLLHDFGNRVMFLQISYSNPDVIYADIDNEGLYRSDDGGLTWESRPSLTNGTYENSYWEGKLHFAISPTDENTIYSCLQNGTWSDDLGAIYKSLDGGTTWEEWTGTLSEYTKNLVVQPDGNGNDLVYLFTNSDNGQSAKVFTRGETDIEWEEYDNGYPAGFTLNLALPFYRDSKMRVGGNAGFWESPLAVEEFEPIVNPWVEKPMYDCMFDTLFFDDHSILNHENSSWHWEFSPAPLFVENVDIRNPKVVLGSPESYDVTLTVTHNGEVYSKTILDMVSAITCPSIDDCSNPTGVPKDIWELVYVDSEEINSPGFATMAFDDDNSTIWHTRWSTGSDEYPHEIQVDMGIVYQVSKFIYLTRQDGQNGRILEYELYITDDLLDWGDAVSIGSFENTAAPQTVELTEPKNGRYFKLVCLSEVNGNAWSSAAEFDVVGCTELNSSVGELDGSISIEAYPIPTSDQLTVKIPAWGNIEYSIFSLDGKIVGNGLVESNSKAVSIDVSKLNLGVYFVVFVDEFRRNYRVKVLKE